MVPNCVTHTSLLVLSFYRSATMQVVLATRNPSLSVKHMNCETKETATSAKILIPYRRSIHLVSQHKEWLVGANPFT